MKARPSWGGWALAGGGKLLALRGKGLTRLNLSTGEESELQGGMSVERQVEAAQDASSIFVLTAPPLNSQTPGKVELTSYAGSTTTLLWSVEPFPGIATPLLAAPLSADGRVIVGVGNRVAALGTGDGMPIWTKTLQALVGCCPAAEQGVFVLPTTHGLEGLRVADGSALWRIPSNPDSFDPSRGPAIEGGRVYFASSERAVTSIDLLTGAILWVSPPLSAPVDTRHPPIADADGVLVPLHGGLARLSKEGALVWTKFYPFMRARAVKPAILSAVNAAFIGGGDGLYAVSPVTGEVAWSAEGLGQIGEVEHIDSELVVVNSEGEVFVFAP